MKLQVFSGRADEIHDADIREKQHYIIIVIIFILFIQHFKNKLQRHEKTRDHIMKVERNH